VSEQVSRRNPKSRALAKPLRSKDPRPEGVALGSPPEGGEGSIHWGVVNITLSPVRPGSIPGFPGRGCIGVLFLHPAQRYMGQTLPIMHILLLYAPDRGEVDTMLVHPGTLEANRVTRPEAVVLLS